MRFGGQVSCWRVLDSDLDLRYEAYVMSNSLTFTETAIFYFFQEHFYLETQVTIAVPKGEDGEMELFVSTQNPTLTQVCWRDTQSF